MTYYQTFVFRDPSCIGNKIKGFFGPSETKKEI